MCTVTATTTSANGAAAPAPSSAAARMFCVSVMMGVFAVWTKYANIPADEYPPLGELHSWKVPAALTVGYLVSLPVLKFLSDNFVSNPKSLLTDCMVLYNVGQVVLNGWTVCYILAALYNGHPFIGSTTATTCSFAVWVHYCDKYLEFFDTYFMVLRNKMDQVTFLHLYHHTTIAWAWWAGMKLFAEGDSYFGALLNSWIHVMMYSYYALTLLGYPCPWKRFLTQAQLLQFASVIVYTAFCLYYNAKDGRLQARHVWACVIQVGEMASLFVLFSRFYKRSYAGGKKGDEKKEAKELLLTKSKSDSNMYVDECAKAIREGGAAANAGYGEECAAAIMSVVGKNGPDVGQTVGAVVQEVAELVTEQLKVGQKVNIEIEKMAERQVEKGGAQKRAAGRPSWSFIGS